MSAPYQHSVKQRRNEPRGKAQRTPYSRNESVWALRRIMLADGTEIAAATKQANMRETEAAKRERLKTERKEMTDVLHYARVHIGKEK